MIPTTIVITREKMRYCTNYGSRNCPESWICHCETFTYQFRMPLINLQISVILELYYQEVINNEVWFQMHFILSNKIVYKIIMLLKIQKTPRKYYSMFLKTKYMHVYYLYLNNFWLTKFYKFCCSDHKIQTKS